MPHCTLLTRRSRTDLEDLFKNYGKIVDMRIVRGLSRAVYAPCSSFHSQMGAFGFVEWENVQDAEDVLRVRRMPVPLPFCADSGIAGVQRQGLHGRSVSCMRITVAALR